MIDALYHYYIFPPASLTRLAMMKPDHAITIKLSVATSHRGPSHCGPHVPAQLPNLGATDVRNLPRRSEAKAGPSQSKPVKPSQTMHWGGGDSPSPQHPPPPPPVYGYGPRLWQSPAAALRPARRSSSTKGSRHPIRHFTLGALRVLRASVAKNLRIICAGRPTFGSVALRQSNPVQVSPTQSNHAYRKTNRNIQHSTPDGIVPQFEPHYHRPGGEAPVESRKRYELSA